MLSRMKSYGQFCSISRALDLLGERWTLLLVRAFLSGSAHVGRHLDGGKDTVFVDDLTCRRRT